jgi:hypothetical protein
MRHKIISFAERDGDFLLRAVAIDDEARSVFGRGLADEAAQFLRARHIFAVEAQDDIVLLQPGLRRRTILQNVRDGHTARLALQIEAAHVFARHVFDVDAQSLSATEAERRRARPSFLDGRRRGGRVLSDNVCAQAERQGAE